MSAVAAIRAKVTRNGQVSLPAAVRRRWGAQSVLVIDRGAYAILRPVPADIVGSLQGAHSGPGPASEVARAVERETDRARGRSRQRAG